MKTNKTKRHITATVACGVLLMAMPVTFGRDKPFAEKLGSQQEGLSSGRLELQSNTPPQPLPTHAKAGECYTQVIVEPTYRTESEKVMTREASQKIEIVAARFEPAEERILVREASQGIEVVPAVWEWTEKKVLVKPAYKRAELVPAVFEAVTKKVIDQPARTFWKKGEGPIDGSKASSLSRQARLRQEDSIMCLVEVPATHKTATKQVLRSPARTTEVEIPAEYTTIKTRVLKTAATTRMIEIPAEYKTVSVMKAIAPAGIHTVQIPAVYENTERSVQVSEGRMEWKSVQCRTNNDNVVASKR